MGEFGEELFVELLVRCLCHLSFLLGAREFGDILVGLFNELLDFRAHGVIVEEFMIALLDACETLASDEKSAGVSYTH